METKLTLKDKTVIVSPDYPFVMIGERINPTRRKKLAATIAEGDFSMVQEDARAQVEAGAFMILLEMVPDRICKLITERTENCIIMSLGSGPDAHGQLLIYHDMFGLYPKFKPKMAKVFGNAGEVILNGLKTYHDEVIEKAFPAEENWFGMKDEEYDELVKMLD
jgi:ketopantoate hydroxymethyltransferase